MKYVDPEKLNAEIKKRIKELDHDKYLSVGSKTARIAELHFIDRLIDTLQREQPSLPSNIDEAAGKYANKEFPDEPSCGQWGTGDYEPPVDMEYPREIAKDAFKAGAEWMAGQGYSQEETVEDKCLEVGYGVLPGISPIINLPDSFKPGEKVIVQIRKKH